MIGKKVGNYSVVRLLGEGGMGAVYEGLHDQLRRRAAIKVLHAEYSQNQEVVARFFNEALAVNVVQHPSLVNVFESGRLPDGNAYIVMEFLDGENLQRKIEQEGALAESEALLIARQIASALAAAHAKEIIHRDLKAENVMLIKDPEVSGGKRVKVLDFGLARVTAKHEGAAAVATKDGVIMGTPSYMPPEQWMSATMADAKTDVYALGVLLYLMLTGRCPFVADNLNRMMTLHMYEAHEPVRKLASSVSEKTEKLVDALLAKKQKVRPTMAEVSTRLEQILASGAGSEKPAQNASAGRGAIETAPTAVFSNDDAVGGRPPGQTGPLAGQDMAWTNLHIEKSAPTPEVSVRDQGVKRKSMSTKLGRRPSVISILGLSIIALIVALLVTFLFVLK